jgi:hypothetical protein
MAEQSEVLDCVFDHRFEYHSDAVEQPDESLGHVLLGIMGEARIPPRTSAHTTRSNHEAAGLALVPGPETGTWRRIGMWTLMAMRDLGESSDPNTETSVFQYIRGISTEEITLV